MSQASHANEPVGPTAKRGTLWRWLVAILVILVVLWLALMFIAAGIVVLVVLLFACAIGAGAIVARRRSSQQDSMLWMLAIATEHSMPLATTARAFADQFGWRYRRLVLLLADRLERGESLPDALDGVPRVVSPDARLLVRAGHESGRLAQALRTTVSAQSEVASLRAGVAAKLSYLLGLLLIVQVIGGFLMYFIMPKFRAIFLDFGIELPAITRWVIQWARFLESFFLAVPLLTVILLVWIPFAVASWSGSSAPLLNRFFKRRRAALILRSLAPFVEAGLPIERGMDMIADHYPTRWVRGRLTKAALRVHQGADWRASLVDAGLIREADRDALSVATIVGNLSWAMNDLAESAERRGRVRVEAWAQTLYPVGVVLMGAVVLFVGMGFFLPLVEMIRRLS